MLLRKKEIESRQVNLIKATLYCLLRRQIRDVKGSYLQDASGTINARAAGYLYGFVQAALRQFSIPLESAEGQDILISTLGAFGGRGEALLSRLQQCGPGNPEYVQDFKAGWAEYDAWINLGGTKSPSGLRACFTR